MFSAQKYENTLEYALNRWCMAWLKLGMDIAFAIRFETLHGMFSKKYSERLEYETNNIKEVKRIVDKTLSKTKELYYE